MMNKMNWKVKAWIGAFIIGLIFVAPLMYLLPRGSTDPGDVGFWQAIYTAFLGLPVTFFIIKWRQKYLDEMERNNDRHSQES